jgi:hypothetical protein
MRCSEIGKAKLHATYIPGRRLLMVFRIALASLVLPGATTEKIQQMALTVTHCLYIYFVAAIMTGIICCRITAAHLK